MGKKLYEIEQQWEEIFEMLADDEIDEEMIFDTLESIEGEFEDKADNYAKIIYNFDLVKEVLSEIYEKLIYDNGNIYQIFNNNKLDKGAIGGIYEKYVIFNMSPENDGYDKILFGSIRVNKVYEVKKFLPNDNENWKKKLNEKKKLEIGTYLFKQKNFNGKGFDVAIFNINDYNNIIVYLFQISINKKEIYSENTLKKFIKTFIEYFQFLFDFKLYINNIYFTYIFDVENKVDLTKKCNEKKMKCIFFQPAKGKGIFMNMNGEKLDTIQNLNEIFICPFKNINDNDIIMKDEILKKKQNVYLNNQQLNKLTNFIIKTFKKQYKDKKINFKFTNNIELIDESFLNNKTIILRNIDENETYWEKFAHSKKDYIKNEDDEEEENKENDKVLINCKLLIIRIKRINFYLIQNDGEIVIIEKLSLRYKLNKIYDVFYILEE